ncbi:hypothetical protein [Kangiella sp. TOML190]|uniref:hypothetical protein n=1 Tax=Kangiella sp. TOML190 TaxID=2931351 RepID=UPI00203E40F3|nr:hypothetical protein [Kangiella sp. TOML190]
MALSVQSAPRKLINGSFEEPEVTLAAQWQLFNETIVPGWDTTAAGGSVELWEGLLGISAPDGDQITELNSTSRATMSQNFCLADGETLSWSFWHRGRSGNERMRLDFGSQTATDVTTGTSFQQYSGSITIVGSGNKNVSLVSISPNSSLGNLVDDLVIPLPPLVEFLAATNGGVEGSGDDIPRLRLNGELSSAGSVDVVVTGGSATDGTDFSLVETVVVPAGDYDGTAATSIPINLTILNTFDLEADETISFGLANALGGVRIADADCDGTNQLSNVYTIADDDDSVDLRVIKNDSQVSYTPGSSGIYVINVFNDGPGDVQDALVVDDLPNGLTLNGAVTCNTSAPSSCNVTSGATEPVNVNVSLESGASAIISIPVLFSADPSDYLP